MHCLFVMVTPQSPPPIPSFAFSSSSSSSPSLPPPPPHKRFFIILRFWGLKRVGERVSFLDVPSKGRLIPHGLMKHKGPTRRQRTTQCSIGEAANCDFIAGGKNNSWQMNGFGMGRTRWVCGPRGEGHGKVTMVYVTTYTMAFAMTPPPRKKSYSIPPEFSLWTKWTISCPKSSPLDK